MSMSLSGFLSERARKSAERQAVVCGKNEYSYREFNERSLCLASVLRKLGIMRQDRVAIIHRNCHCFLESYFATAYIDAVLVPINYRLTASDFTYILNDSDSDILITQPDFFETIQSVRNLVPRLREVVLTGERAEGAGTEKMGDALTYEELIADGNPEEPEVRNFKDDDIAQLYYTSGTTGRPKGVPLTHRNNYLHAHGTIQELDLTDKDRWLHVSPMFHLADAWAVWSITLAGGAHIMVPDFNPREVLETISRQKATLSNFVPTMLNMLLNTGNMDDYDLNSFRLVLSGGAPISEKVVRMVLDRFKCEYAQTYGMTETSPFLTMSILKEHLKRLPFEERLRFKASTGRPFITIELKVVDENGKEVRKDDKHVGEIIVKGETITSGYWKLPEETGRRFKDGWLHTGDLATINVEGYVTIVDRIDNMIVTGGENVYSIEVENVLYAYPGTLEVAVIGLPNELWGQRIVAIIAPKTGYELKEKEIIEFCRKRLARFKAPKQVIFVKEIPKTGSGKISKKSLRQMYCAGGSG